MTAQIGDSKPHAVTMLRTVSLPVNLTRGSLYLCSMPGRLEALEIFLQEIAQAEIGHILCLVSDQEIAQKSPAYLAAIQQNQIPARLWRYDVPDYGLAEDSEDLKQAVDGIRERLDGGESVVIHCAAGHGRTGMISILLLTRMGLPFEAARLLFGVGRAHGTTLARSTHIGMRRIKNPHFFLDPATFSRQLASEYVHSEYVHSECIDGENNCRAYSNENQY